MEHLEVVARCRWMQAAAAATTTEMSTDAQGGQCRSVEKAAATGMGVLATVAAVVVTAPFDKASMSRGVMRVTWEAQRKLRG